MINENKIDGVRKFHLPLAELIDRLTVTQIKQVKIQSGKASFQNEIDILCNDIDLLLETSNVRLDARLVRILILLSQINLHIWSNKDEMQKNIDNEENYLQLLKLAHQLNGIRNTMKNHLMEQEGDVEESHRKSNFETDGLDWNFLV